MEPGNVAFTYMLFDGDFPKQKLRPIVAFISSCPLYTR